MTHTASLRASVARVAAYLDAIRQASPTQAIDVPAQAAHDIHALLKNTDLTNQDRKILEAWFKKALFAIATGEHFDESIAAELRKIIVNIQKHQKAARAR